MAFTLQSWGRVSVTANEPAQILLNGDIVGVNRMFNYFTADTQAQIAAANYFNEVAYDIAININTPNDTWGDFVYAFSATDGVGVFYQLTNNNGVVTCTAFNNIAAVNTGDIVNLAVTAGKMANHTITDTQVSLNGLTSLSMQQSYGQFLSNQLSSANIQAMYGAPIVLIPAPGANRVIVVEKFTCQLQFNAAQYTGGGAVGLQYGAAAANPHLAGPAASATFANGANVNLRAAQSQLVSVAGAANDLQLAGLANTAVCISNDTAAFAAGNSVVNWYIKYSVLTTT